MSDTFYLVSQGFSVAAALFALWKGGAAERLAAGVVLFNLAVGSLCHWLSVDGDGLIRLGNDGLAAVALLVITLRYGALWMGAVMLFYAAQFSLHAYYLVTERPPDYLHALVNNINWYGVVWSLIIGAAMAWRQRIRAAKAEASKGEIAPAS
ncbi:hypothetical protein [Phenylobacterium sp.]|uniref:hypothetical protein n=1 Tax=Phenylobacterium sp. TaxID=1871053 RepID=UPI002DF082DD|nr:hypothetical protein [Phenylobacterium sp.]